MPFSFPASPSVGQTSVQNGRIYVWSGAAWQLNGNVPATFATTTAGFPATGNLNYIYCATDSNRFYRWTGSVYVELGPVGGGEAGLGANDPVDGGTYTGTILGGITFTVQPQSQTVSTSSTLTLAATANLPIRGQVLALGGNLFAASGNAANMVRSADNGGNWTTLSALPSIVTGDSDAAYSRGSLASNGTRTVLSWTGTSVRYSDSADLSSVTAVTYAAGDRGPQTYIAYSATAGRWVLAESGTTVASSILGLYSSSDGVTWTGRSTLDGGNPAAKILRVVSVNGVFVAMTSNPSDSYSRSTDGVAWTSVGTPFSGGDSADVASSGTRAVAISGTAVRWTADGTSWGSAALPVSCVRIEYARGLFWAWPNGTTDLCTSPDGVTWTLRTKPSATRLHGIAAATNASVALATYGYSFSITSFPGLTATFTGTTASANFTVSATAEGGASVSYQWQRSLDAGSTWANIANATSAALNLTGLTTANTAERYRAVASATGAATKNSQSATLTVTE